MSVVIPRRSNDRLPRWGFSLIEVMIVLVVLAAIAGIAAPRYARSLDEYRLDVAALRLERDLARARNQAFVLSAPVSIAFSVDPGPSQYTISGLDDPDRPGAPYTVRLSDEPYGAVITHADFEGDGVLSYNAYSIPNSGGSVTIARGTRQRTITVESATNLDAFH